MATSLAGTIAGSPITLSSSSGGIGELVFADNAETPLLMRKKTLVMLIDTLNELHPDFDFSDVRAEQFESMTNLQVRCLCFRSLMSGFFSCSIVRL